MLTCFGYWVGGSLAADVFNSIVKRINRKIDLPILSEESENTVFMLMLLLLYLFLSALLVWGTYDQGWTFFEAFYFNFISYSTISFGDYYLTGRMGNSASVMGTTISLFIGLALLASLVGAVTDYFQRQKPALRFIRSMKRMFSSDPEDRDVKAQPSTPGGGAAVGGVFGGLRGMS